VQKIALLKLIGDVLSWAELEARIISLPTEIERGEAFEQFCKAFILFNPIFQTDKVYRQNEIPHSPSQTRSSAFSSLAGTSTTGWHQISTPNSSFTPQDA